METTPPTPAEDLAPEPDRFRSYWTPEVLGLVGFALAIGAMLGAGVLSGGIVAALGTELGGQPSGTVQVLSGLLSAAFAALPLLLGLEAVRNLLEDDPLWVAALSRATVLLAAIVVFLRLAQTLANAVSEGGSPYFLY